MTDLYDELKAQREDIERRQEAFVHKPCQERIAQLERELEQAQDRFANAQDSARILRSMLDESQNKCDSLRAELSQAQAELERVTGERDCYKSVLDSAEFERVSELPSRGVEFCRAVGRRALERMVEIKVERDCLRSELEQAKSQLTETIIAMENAYIQSDGDPALRLINYHKWETDKLLARLSQMQSQIKRPIDMLLFCPNCGEQHVDEAKPDVCETCGGVEDEYTRDANARVCVCPVFTAWLNPPHKSHRCGNCNHVFRPADVPTNGVLTIKTKGERDGDPRPRFAESQADLARLRGETIEECAKAARACKYYDRGEGLEDADPHSDEVPDYERDMLDEKCEEVVRAIRALKTEEGK